MAGTTHEDSRWQGRLPQIIQGGMGAGVSSWALAHAVAKAGQLGVVSGTALDLICARRLQCGDEGGHVRRALSHFPVPAISERIIERYFVEGGKASDVPFLGKPMVGHDPSPLALELMVAAAFVEVYLAREGHKGLVGINLLEKIQAPNLATIYGAMLAEVDVVTMGAGVPAATPRVLDDFASGRPSSFDLHFPLEKERERPKLTFDPRCIFPEGAPRMRRPIFLPIIASVTLATMLMKKCGDGIDGFVIELPTAGGHNAPPRGRLKLSDKGEPVYSIRDEVDYEAIARHGLPYWLAGSFGSPEAYRQALELGAQGIQVGTLFAFCDESGLEPGLKQKTREMSLAGRARVFTDPVASPTGFPFKVLRMENTNSEAEAYEARTRVCDLGYLRHAYRRPDGGIGWRCASEPLEAWVKKGGDPAEAKGRKCLCNGLMANIGMPQVRRDGSVERPLLTAGDEVCHIHRLMTPESPSYAAGDVLNFLLQNRSEFRDHEAVHPDGS